MSVSPIDQRIIVKIKTLHEDEKQLLVDMLKELKGNIDESLQLGFIVNNEFTGIAVEMIEVLKKIGPSKDFYTIKEATPKYSGLLYYPFFTLEQINVILKGLDNKITQDIITNLTKDLYTNGNIVSLTYNKFNKEITIKDIKAPDYAASSSQQKSLPPLAPPPQPPPPPPPPASYGVLFPAGLQILRIQRGYNYETDELLPEEFFVGFSTLNKLTKLSLTDLSRDLKESAHIISIKENEYTKPDGSKGKSWNKTVHTENPKIGYYIVLTFLNIKNIIDNFTDLQRYFGGQILKFLNQIYEAMYKYKITNKEPTTTEFETFFVELDKFIEKKVIENSLRYKYLKYKMKYLELKNKNKL